VTMVDDIACLVSAYRVGSCRATAYNVSSCLLRRRSICRAASLLADGVRFMRHCSACAWRGIRPRRGSVGRGAIVPGGDDGGSLDGWYLT